ncbi:MAG: RluA family pseudouridine synthase [Pseudobdellovibrionaceae bacterium]|nr:RluA family pseudouridine synthase [Bdellovibrionales bacterium]USN49012.1 MAG: RluA family pseudouridine synthase [Pseudobdellovibrionaceae bacterium]
MQFNTFKFKVASEDDGVRLDRALSAHPLVGTRSRAAKLIQCGWVRLNGRAAKASHVVHSDEIYDVKIPVDQKSELLPYDFPLDVLFEDKDLLVLNKPAGLVVHPAAGHHQDTLVNALVHQAKDLSMGFSENRPGIVHRLDKDTSGLLVVAKNDFTQSHLSAQFRQKTVHRIYWALVYGPVKQAQGTQQTYLKRHPVDRKKFASERLIPEQTPSGKLAITHFRQIRSHASGVTHLQCQLETGRTHQIRVHLSELGHPILGDEIYGSNSRTKNLKSVELRKLIKQMQRIGLHAAELGFTHPQTGEELMFRSSWPDDLLPLVELLGFS